MTFYIALALNLMTPAVAKYATVQEACENTKGGMVIELRIMDAWGVIEGDRKAWEVKLMECVPSPSFKVEEAKPKPATTGTSFSAMPAVITTELDCAGHPETCRWWWGRGGEAVCKVGECK